MSLQLDLWTLRGSTMDISLLCVCRATRAAFHAGEQLHVRLR